LGGARITVKAGTDAALVNVPLSLDTWYWITFKYRANASYTALTCSLYASGGGAILDTDVANSGVAGANLADIVLGRTDATETETYEMNFDDVLVVPDGVIDAWPTYPPEVEIRACLPTSDYISDWQATTGNHFADLNDVPYSDAAMIYVDATDTVGDQDLLQYDAGGLNADWDIYGIAMYMVAKCGTTGFESPVFYLEINGAGDYSASVSASSSYRGYAFFANVNLDSGDIWYVSEIQDVIAGVELQGAVPTYQMNVPDFQLWVAQIVEAPPYTGAKATCGGIVAKSPKVVLTG
jgi:hypothetical protein